MKQLLTDISPTISGASGYGMLSITPGNIADAGQLIIVLATVLTQLFAIFKRKKNVQEKN